MNTIQRRFTKESYALHCAAVRNGLSTINAVCEIINQVSIKMDGKEVTKRWTNAINAEIEKQLGEKVASVMIGKDYDGRPRRLEIYLYTRSYKNESGNWTYFDDEIPSSLYLDCCFTISKEIMSEKTIRTIQYNSHKIAVMADALKNWDKNIARVKKVETYLMNMAKEINPEFIGEKMFNNSTIFFDMWKVADSQID